jgi:hypothetical protein
VNSRGPLHCVVVFFISPTDLLADPTKIESRWGSGVRPSFQALYPHLPDISAQNRGFFILISGLVRSMLFARDPGARLFLPEPYHVNSESFLTSAGCSLTTFFLA